MQTGGPEGNRRNSAFLVVRTAAVLAAAALLALASLRVVREAYAEQLYWSSEIAQLRRAAQLSPGCALYRVALADLLDRAGGDPRPALREAARLSPTDDSIWIRLGLAEELAGHPDEAEAHLLEAARVSRKYLPRWTLANFYYRRGRPEAVWRWAREALAVSYGDRSAVFDLCWSLRAEPEFLIERVIPPRRDVVADYAGFLVARSQFRTAAAIYEKLAAEAQPGDLGRFLDATDRLLGSGEYEGARGVWNALCRRRLIPYPPLEEHSGPAVTNADFSRWTLGRGFDWRVEQTPGVVVAPDPGRGWRIVLSGDQPERCEILSQPLLLEPGRRYELGFRARASLAGRWRDAPSGLRWQVASRSGQVWVESVWPPGEEIAAQAREFRVPPGGGACELKLVHERIAGSVRAQGAVELISVTIRPGEG